MARALELAARGIGATSPNPRVGAVIVRGGKIIAEGWHAKAGADHAEISALKKLSHKAAGATLYVTLEPCSTQGQTPPCTEAIIKSGIKRVVIAMTDPNPAHRGRGIRLLRRHGVEISCGLLRTQAAALNAGFIKFHTEGLPYVIAKAAVSLDGKIATVTGDSKWITNEKSRRYAHRLRRESDAVLVGIGTVIKDDPELTVRHVACKGNQPRRVVIDAMAKIGMGARLLQSPLADGTIVAVSRDAAETKIEKIRGAGANVIFCKSRKNRINLRDLLGKLAKEGILYVLIEGGSGVLTSAFNENLVDEVAFFYAPILIGGENAPTLFGGKGIEQIKNSLQIKNIDIQRFDDNILICGTIKK